MTAAKEQLEKTIIRADMAETPGIDVQMQTDSGGPGGGKPINLEVFGNNQADQNAAVQVIAAEMMRMGGFIDIVDTRPSPGVEWQISVNRSEAAHRRAAFAACGSDLCEKRAGPDADGDWVEYQLFQP